MSTFIPYFVKEFRRTNPYYTVWFRDNLVNSKLVDGAIKATRIRQIPNSCASRIL
jgi:hypothetical protein